MAKVQKFINGWVLLNGGSQQSPFKIPSTGNERQNSDIRFEVEYFVDEAGGGGEDGKIKSRVLQKLEK